MADPTDNLTPKQVAVLAALLAGRSIETAATEAKVSAGTVHRWLDTASFRAAMRAGLRQIAQQGLARVQSRLASYLDVLDDIVLDDKKPASVRLRGVQIAIEATVKWLELDDFEARLRALEDRNG